MVLGAMETPSSVSPIPTKNPTTNGTISPPKNKNPQTQTQTQSLYRECLKNHAASIGGHALDGCGEFMPSPTAVPSDPTSFKCAACNCHRNFHRRHNQKSTPNSSPSLSLSPSPSPTPSPQSPPPISHLPPNSSFFSSPPPPPPAQMLLALSTGERLRLSAESSRKRFRTKFTSEQKEKMSAFADRLGWRMQRSEEKLVEQFCDEIGVRRGVLKVWMHNNKHTLRKRSVLLPGGGAGNELGGGLSGGSTANGGEDDDEKLDEEETKSGLNFFANNGSSSTS